MMPGIHPRPGARRRARPLIHVFGACLVVLALGGGSASAATVTLKEFVEEPGADVDGRLAVTAANGEVNTLTVSHYREPESSGTGDAEAVTVTDETAPLEAGEGCENETPNRVRCEAGSRFHEIFDIRVELGNLDDRADAVYENFTPPEGNIHTDSRPFIGMVGGAGDDALAGAGVADILDGGPGNDSLAGEGEDDLLYGGPGEDRLDGGPANDSLDGGTGDDVLLGGDGDDSILAGGSADDRGPAGTDRLEGGAGNDALADDDLSFGGGVGPDTLIGGTGDDRVDSYLLRTEAVSVDLTRSVPQGQPGENDRLEEVEHVSGGSGDDVLLGNDEVNSLAGFAGDDLIHGRGGDDRIQGSWGNDALGGGEGDDTLIGHGGDDTLIGHEGDDTLDGGGGVDNLVGHDGDDVMDDGDGDGGTATDSDSYDGGDGRDTVTSYRSRTERVRVNLSRSGDQGEAGENDMIDAVEHVFGGSGDDVLVGNGATNLIDGGRGADRVNGRAGSDWITGDRGRDNLRGGKQDDTIGGGRGTDRVNGQLGRDSIAGGEGDDRLRGGKDPDVFLGGSDNDLDVTRCDRGHDISLDSDARDVLRRSCEDAAWASRPLRDRPLERTNRITVEPRIGASARRAFFYSTCTEDDPCRGKIELKTPNSRKPLGQERFKLPVGQAGSTERETIAVRLNRRGQRRVRRGRSMRIAIAAECEQNCGTLERIRTGFTTYVRK